MLSESAIVAAGAMVALVALVITLGFRFTPRARRRRERAERHARGERRPGINLFAPASEKDQKLDA